MRKKETPNPSRVRGRGVEVSETLFYAVLSFPNLHNIYFAPVTTALSRAAFMPERIMLEVYLLSAL